MRIMIFATAALAVCGAAMAAETPRPVEPLDLYRLEQPLEPQLAPDGRTAAFLRQTRSAMTDKVETELWLIGAYGKNARLLVGAEKGPTTPRWSPDGRTIAFVGKEGAKSQVFAVSIADPRPRLLTSLAHRPAALAWSGDSRMVAFSSLVEETPKALYELPAKPEGAAWADAARVIEAMPYRLDSEGQTTPGRRQLFVVPADGSEPARAITRGPGDWGLRDDAVAFTADATALIASADLDPNARRRANQGDLYRIPLDGAPPQQLTSDDGFEASPALSPDGRAIAYVGWRNSGLSHQQTEIFVIPAAGGEARSLTAPLDRTASQPRWRADGRAVFFLYQDKGVNRIGQAPARPGGPRLGPVGAVVGNTRLLLPSSGGTFSSAAGAFAYASVEADRPAALALFRNGRETALWDLNAAWRAERTIGALEEIWVPSSADGRKIHAWILFPPNFDPARRYPLALDIHGGPHLDYGPMFSITHHLYAAAGYVTVFANPRGSIGYGLEFAALIDKAYPGDDHADLMSVVDAVAARPGRSARRTGLPPPPSSAR
jgi:dipeptidyl aminopeptidase/acylaminoacyl peptidase